MADPFLQFIDLKGKVHPSPEAAIASDIESATGFNPVLSRGIVERRDVLRDLLAELDTLLVAFGPQIKDQNIERMARKARQPGDKPQSAEQAGAITGE